MRKSTHEMLSFLRPLFSQNFIFSLHWLYSWNFNLKLEVETHKNPPLCNIFFSSWGSNPLPSDPGLQWSIPVLDISSILKISRKWEISPCGPWSFPVQWTILRGYNTKNVSVETTESSISIESTWMAENMQYYKMLLVLPSMVPSLTVTQADLKTMHKALTRNRFLLIFCNTIYNAIAYLWRK